MTLVFHQKSHFSPKKIKGKVFISVWALFVEESVSVSVLLVNFSTGLFFKSRIKEVMDVENCGWSTLMVTFRVSVPIHKATLFHSCWYGVCTVEQDTVFASAMVPFLQRFSVSTLAFVPKFSGGFKTLYMLDRDSPVTQKTCSLKHQQNLSHFFFLVGILSPFFNCILLTATET